MQETKILCVDDEKNILQSLQRIFFDEPFTVFTAESAAAGLKILESQGCQIIISDYRMPDMNGVDFLNVVRKRWPHTIRLVLSGYADVASIVSAINEGEIYKFIPKPWNDDELKITVNHAIEKYKLEEENRTLTAQLVENNRKLGHLNKNLEVLVEEKIADLLIQNKSLRLSQHILDILPVGIVGIDNDGRIVQVNNAALEIFGKAGKNIIGSYAHEIISEDIMAIAESITDPAASEQIPESSFISGRLCCIPLRQGSEQLGRIIILIPNS